jgi:hypothetical protein
MNQFTQPLIELVTFIKNRPDIARNLSIIFFPLSYILFESSIVFNEELLIVVCFMIAVYFLYSELGNSIEESLNERSNKIKTDLVAFDVIKLDHLNNLHKTTLNVLEIQSQINDLHSFSVQSIDCLDQNQKQAFVGLVSKNIVEKLQILTNLNKMMFGNHLVESFNGKISRQFHATKRVFTRTKIAKSKKTTARNKKSKKS